jgi:hypothetical protein
MTLAAALTGTGILVLEPTPLELLASHRLHSWMAIADVSHVAIVVRNSDNSPDDCRRTPQRLTDLRGGHTRAPRPGKAEDGKVRVARSSICEVWLSGAPRCKSYVVTRITYRPLVTHFAADIDAWAAFAGER